MSSANQTTNIPPSISSRNVETYNCDNYFDVFEKIQCFYGEQRLCDVTLTDASGKTKVRAHRLILSARSEYFSTMFNGSFNEAESNEVKLEDIDGKTLQMVIRFLYSNTIDLEGDTVENVTKAAHLLQIKSLEVLCCDYFKKDIEPSNVLGILSYANRYNMTTLSEYASEFALDHFMELMHNDEFFLLDVLLLGSLISSDSVHASEEDIFRSTLAWVQHDPERREQFFGELFQHLRLTLLSPEFIAKTVEPAIKSSECKKLVSIAYQWHLMPELRQSLVPKRQIHRRISNNVLLAIDGWNNIKSDLRVALYSTSVKEWSFRGCPRPLGERTSFGFTTLSEKLYIAGGLQTIGQCLNSVSCLDLKTFQWTRLPPMLTARYDCGMAALNGQLYVVGGKFCRSIFYEPLESVENWDPAIGAWKYITPMKKTVKCPIVGVKGSKLCVARDNHDDQRILDIYDPLSKEWSFGWSSAPGDLLGMGTVSINRVAHFVTISKTEIKVCNLENNNTETISVNGAQKFALFNDSIIIKSGSGFKKYSLVENKCEPIPDVQGTTSECLVFGM